MFSKKQIAILTGLMMVGMTGSAQAQDVCALQDEVAEIESDLESLSNGARVDAGDGIDAEYGPRLLSVAETTEAVTTGLPAAVASANSLDAKLDALRQKLSDMNRNPYLIDGLDLADGAYPVLSWPSGVDSITYPADASTVVTCSSPAKGGSCVHSVTPPALPPGACTPNDPNWLMCDTVVINTGPVLDGTIGIVQTTLDFDFTNPLTPKPVTPELVSYIEELGKDPEAVLGICNSALAVFGVPYASEWASEPALRLAKKIRQDSSVIDEHLAELEANPPLAPEQAGNPDAIAAARASYQLARKGLSAFETATEEEVAKFIHASSLPYGNDSGVWRYLYAMEQAEMLLDGLHGRTDGWSSAKLSAYEGTRANVERLLQSRSEQIRNKAFALNQEWEAAVYGEPMLLVDLFKSPDYPDNIGLAMSKVDEEARADLPLDVARIIAGAGVTGLPLATLGAAAIVSTGITAAVAGGIKGASLFAGIATLTATTTAGGATVAGGAAAGVAGTVAIVAFPVTVAVLAITASVVAGKDAWATMENHKRYETWMANYDKSYDLAQLGDEAFRAAYIVWALAWYPKHGIGVGMGC